MSAIEKVSARRKSCAAARMFLAALHMNKESAVAAADVASPAACGRQRVPPYELRTEMLALTLSAAAAAPACCGEQRGGSPGAVSCYLSHYLW